MSTAEPPPPGDLPYDSRELSWLDFNDRVLQLAEDGRLPLLERIKFCAIFTSNLDEFFMVRVAGLHDQVAAGLQDPGPAGLTPSATIERIHDRVTALQARLDRCFEGELRPALDAQGIHVVRRDQLADEECRDLDAGFVRHILPVLTPLAVGPGRPFPYISNLSVSLAVLVHDPVTGHSTFARVKVPKEVIPRFVALGDRGSTYVALEEMIAAHLDALFPGMEIRDHGFFRVTRDADFTISDEADDLLEAVETELRQRRFGEVLRVEIARGMSPALRDQLIQALTVAEHQIYEVCGPLDLADLWQIVSLPGHRDLRESPWTPEVPLRLQECDDGAGADVFAAVASGDLLVHHPYDSFAGSVERFMAQAVDDPDVLAVKQTVYRTSDDSALMPALIRAAERGKQVVCLVELTARFDEQANIEWARRLERAGAHVTYGIPGLKTHAKALLVVRREADGVRRYVHIGTGNYNTSTAGLYTDFGLFTTDPDLCDDVADLFNYLTGYARPGRYRKALVAPGGLRDGIVDRIELAIEAHRPEAPARIAMKMNSLVDERCIEALYRASCAGVCVDLNVRGICCLRPGVAGVSENIRVTSIVGRFLEHARIFAFWRGGEIDVLIGSADLMPRNLDARVELLAPVDHPAAREQVLDVLERSLADRANAWELLADGTWRRLGGDGDPDARDVHRELMAAVTEGLDARVTTGG